MNRKKWLVTLSLLLIAVLCMSACSTDPTGSAGTDADPSVPDETTEAETTEAEPSEPIPVELPTDSKGTFDNTALVVVEMTAFDRKADGSLVKETAFEKLNIKKGTFTEDGKEKEAYVGTYKVSKEADVVYFSLTCSLGDMAGIVMGREFKRADGNDTMRANYKDAEGEVYPLVVNVVF